MGTYVASPVDYDGKPLKMTKGIEIGDGKTKIAEDKNPGILWTTKATQPPIKKTGWQIIAIELDPSASDECVFGSIASFTRQRPTEKPRKTLRGFYARTPCPEPRDYVLKTISDAVSNAGAYSRRGYETHRVPH
ncbi:MAG: hypothetical protein NVSMB15_12590 [Steroidobacteraceae bacterium]